MAVYKFLLAICLLESAITQDFEGSGSERNTGRSCFVGIGSSYEDIESETSTCNFLERACQAKVEVTKDGMRVFGECKELVACENNAENKDCYSQFLTREMAAEESHVCHFCCQGSLCNTASFVQAGIEESQEKLLNR